MHDVKRRDELGFEVHYKLEWHKQAGNCGICLESGRKLFRDHCHKRGILRGWLCSKCNTRLRRLVVNEPEGWYGPKNLYNAATAYINRYGITTILER